MKLNKKTIPIRKEIHKMEFRLEQVERALSHLMYVVANQEEELDSYKKSMDKAHLEASKFTSLIGLLNSEGGEA